MLANCNRVEVLKCRKMEIVTFSGTANKVKADIFKWNPDLHENNICRHVRSVLVLWVQLCEELCGSCLSAIEKTVWCMLSVWTHASMQTFPYQLLHIQLFWTIHCMLSFLRRQIYSSQSDADKARMFCWISSYTTCYKMWLCWAICNVTILFYIQRHLYAQLNDWSFLAHPSPVIHLLFAFSVSKKLNHSIVIFSIFI